MLRNPFFLLAIGLPTTFASAQALTDPSATTIVNKYGQEVTVVAASSFRITPPLREWSEAITEEAEQMKRESHDGNRPLPPMKPLAEQDPPTMDAALQLVPATHRLRTPLVSFNGQNGSGYPPDPTGAAGPDHYVQAVNTAFRVYTKTGTGVGAAHNLSSLWAGSADEGDPIVLYDRHADRWFISQFNSGSPNHMLLALSQTGDPTGAYYTWSFNFTSFPDYPKFSVWWDGYYMTSNSSKTAIVFEREAMLTGSANARMVALSAPNALNDGFRSVLPADADGEIPPAGTPCYFFNLEDNGWNGVTTDRIKVYEMTTDWNTLANTNVVLSRTLTTTAFDGAFPANWDDIAQPGTTQKLDAIAGVFNFRAQYMRWGGYNTVVLCNVVDVNGSDHAGIRWYELRDADDGQWNIYQQGTWSPDAAHRWIGSIAMDAQGNIGLAYSHSDPANSGYPGLRYTGRYANDPLGQMTVAEQVGVNGTASQSGFNRYGDYAHLSLDPNGTTFWFTGEYIGSGGNARTRIFSFDLAADVSVQENDPLYATAAMHVVDAGGILEVSVDGLSSDDPLGFDVIGLNGGTVRHQDAEPRNKRWSTRVDVRDLAAGPYFVRVANGRFQKAQRIVIPGKR